MGGEILTSEILQVPYKGEVGFVNPMDQTRLLIV